MQEVGWDSSKLAKLWRYNLHYFDDLNAQQAAARSNIHHSLIEDWIRCNPPGVGTAWEPYPTSLRIVNWIKWFLRDESAARAEYLWSLAIQARWLAKRLEFHLLGNHLIANAKALVFAGIFFDGAEAQAWYETGARILRGELHEQILDDGGHFELSPMYHALVFEDVLDLINLLQAVERNPTSDLYDSAREKAPRMLHWLRCMSHPNGELSAFNDCAEGIALSTTSLEDYACDLGVHHTSTSSGAMVHLDASGYVRVACDGAVALLDVARVGPDYLPGHAHADTLSFELSIGAQRVVVNGGTSCYAVGEQRSRERGTRLHSTVEVAGVDSSEVWSAFRVGRRAYPINLEISDRAVCCSHDGYSFLKGQPIHRRCWRFEGSSLIVEDTLSVADVSATARFLLAPGLRAQPVGEHRWSIVKQDAAIGIIEVKQGRGSMETSTHAPRFGVTLPVDTIRVALCDGRAAVCLGWSADQLTSIVG